MTSVWPSGFPTEWNQQSYDDLTVIKGIGLARQQWLRESFNVRTLKDLAALSLDEVEAQLKAAGQITSRRIINQWLDQAKQQIVVNTQAALLTAGSTKAANATVDNPANKDSWKPIASFVVDFQTRTSNNQIQEQQIKVHHIESDTCATWSKAEYAQVCQWMLDKLDTYSARRCTVS